jgi:hypothetical protein
MADNSTKPREDEVTRLMEEVDRYRTATEDALQQLDWCIGYFVGCNKASIAKALGANRSHIRGQIRRKELPVPTPEDSGREGRSSRG